MSNLQLRKANESDAELTFKWASDPVVRAFSFNTKPIRFEEHCEWFKQKVNDNNCLYYIAYSGEQPVGSIRYDIIDNEAVISFLLDPAFHGKGLSPILLEEGGKLMIQDISNNIRPGKITGFVLTDNVASQKAFIRAGYAQENINEEKIKFTRLI